MYYISNMPLYPRVSFSTLPAAYAMMASRMTWLQSTRQGGDGVDFVAVVDQVIALLRQRGRVTYRTLKRQFQLDAEALEDLKDELLDAQHLACDEQGSVLVWTGAAETPPSPPSPPAACPSSLPHGPGGGTPPAHRAVL